MRKNFGEFGNTKGYRDTMRMSRKLHEEELTLQEKIEKSATIKICLRKTSTILDYLKYTSNAVQI